MNEKRLVIVCPECEEGKLSLSKKELADVFSRLGEDSAVITPHGCSNPECGNVFLPEEIQEAKKYADNEEALKNPKPPKGSFRAFWEK